jgi:SulP family sulfate permease
MDRLRRSHFLDDLTGQVFLSQYDALRALSPGLVPGPGDPAAAPAATVPPPPAARPAV